VGNEFSSVEALWSHLENIMAKEEPQERASTAEGGNEGNDEATL